MTTSIIEEYKLVQKLMEVAYTEAMQDTETYSMLVNRAIQLASQMSSRPYTE